ncbi:MAG: helix-turn-helix domain-containing protein [Pseudomonadota bacterium]
MNKNDATGGDSGPSFDDFEREWLTNAEAARVLGLTPDTLRDYRPKGRSPRFYKRGQYVFYRRSDVEAFLAEREKSDG